MKFSVTAVVLAYALASSAQSSSSPIINPATPSTSGSVAESSQPNLGVASAAAPAPASASAPASPSVNPSATPVVASSNSSKSASANAPSGSSKPRAHNGGVINIPTMGIEGFLIGGVAAFFFVGL